MLLEEQITDGVKGRLTRRQRKSKRSRGRQDKEGRYKTEKVCWQILAEIGTVPWHERSLSTWICGVMSNVKKFVVSIEVCHYLVRMEIVLCSACQLMLSSSLWRQHYRVAMIICSLYLQIDRDLSCRANLSKSSVFRCYPLSRIMLVDNNPKTHTSNIKQRNSHAVDIGVVVRRQVDAREAKIFPSA